MPNRARPPQRSPLALAVLAALVEEPMHPYQMQRLIKERGKDKVINVRQRTGIYQTIERLLRDGLIEVAETSRDGRRPERTVYQVTEEGRQTAQDWMLDMLSTPATEFPEFPAALSLLGLLTPADAIKALELRATLLQGEVARGRAMMETFQAALPRLFLIEEEYVMAMRKAELHWVMGLLRDLRSGALAWSEEGLRRWGEESRGAPSLRALPAPPRREDAM
jgi:DNA-binding PadR family transcriptional regulator